MTEYPEKLTSGYYRVKLDEEQLGQFRILSKAKALCNGNAGSCVYAPDGTAIYPADVAVAEAEYADAAERTEIVETTDIAEPVKTTEHKVLEIREDGWLEFVCPDSPTGVGTASTAGWSGAPVS